MNARHRILVEISPGELYDKITILRLKASRIGDAAKLANVRTELAMLETIAAESLEAAPEIDELIAQLASVNRRLWDIEDDIRRCEARQDFGSGFVALARSVYRTNDERSDVKRRINAIFGSMIVEEKQYADYKT